MSIFGTLVFAILFEGPVVAALTASGAVSIPIIIHLLNRRRFRVVEWAAMRFLLTAQRKNARRMRIEQLILLLLRCLLVLVLLLAMVSVTPWAEQLWRALNPAGGKGLVLGGSRIHRILVIDGTLSMSLKADDKTLFDRAKDFAEKVVEEGSGGDGFSVVLMASPPRRIVPEPSEDARKVISEIRNLRMTHGDGDLPGTLATVAGLLRASPGKFPAKEVYFLTDLQRSAWISGRPGDLTPALQTFQELKAKAIFVDVGRDAVSNLAVTGLEMGDPVVTTQGKVPILATLFNHGDTRDDVAVRLFVGKARASSDEKPCQLREVSALTVRARRNEQTNVTFTYRFPAPGDYVVQVHAAHDDLELDDIRGAVVRVKNTVPVMLVNGKPANEAFDRASEWARVALNPFDEGREVPPGIVFRPKVVTQSQFMNGESGKLADYDAVFLCDVPRLTSAEVRHLEGHVRAGGAVVVSLGDHVDLGAYNDSLYRDGQGLLPARLISKEFKDGYVYQLTMDPEADRLDPLRMFQEDAARERLLAPHFRRFVQTEPARAVRGVVPRKILGFTPIALPVKRGGTAPSPPPSGGPAVLEWQPPLPTAERAMRTTERDDTGAARAPLRTPPQRGRVVLITSTLNSDWNRWPVSPAFPAFLQETLFYAAQPRLRERALGVGEPIELHLTTTALLEANVELPRDLLDGPIRSDGNDAVRKQMTQTLGDGSVLRFGETDTSGIYKVRLGQHPQEHLFAVNVPAMSSDAARSESNLARTNKEEVEKTYPEWDTQVVTTLKQVEHAQATTTAGETIYTPQGNGIAHILLLVLLGFVLLEVVLAWQFGHYSTVPSMPGEQAARAPGLKEWALWGAPWLLFVLLGAVGFILIHNAVTGDFLAFLPEGMRAMVERAFDIPPPAPGEGSRWRLEFSSYFWDAKSDPWLIGALALLAAVGIALIYRQEGHGVRAGFRALLLGLRLGLVLLILVVFLPQLKLYFERQGWPDVVILIDDSQSMSSLDVYRDKEVGNAAGALAKKAELTEDEKAELARALALRSDLTPASRLRLAQTFLTGNGDAWLRDLLLKRKVRVHVYRCSTRAQRLADVSSVDELEGAVKAVREMTADPSHDSSQLGSAVRQALNDFRGSSLAAVIMLTDGVTTEGEDLAGVSKYAAQMGVPLFFIGVGDAHELRDVYLHDLQCEDSVYVGDRIIFELKLTAQGYKNLTLPVTLVEKGKDRVLDPKSITVEEDSKTKKVRLVHRPTEPGEKTYVIRVPVQEGEVDKENNQLERTVHVRETKQIKVLYVEGYRRYEYHYLKTLLERESKSLKGNKSVNLKVVLLDADESFALQDRTALVSIPTPFRNVDTHMRDDDLYSYDVVILGDVDPETRADARMAEHLKNLADFVRERGGGLLVLAGERFSPSAFKNTPLKDILPIDLTGEKVSNVDPEEGIEESYRTELTPIGRMHPMFRFSPDEKENDDIFARLKEFYWFADGYVPKRAAEVLATHPTLKGAGKGGEKHPLIVQQFAGSGRCMFFGVNELWRWNWREDQQHYNQFWVQTVRYLARTKVGRIELRLDRQTPYRRGEPIKVHVRFPDDERPPPDSTEVKVVYERRVPGKAGDRETSTLKLSKLEGSRATFESILTTTPEGEYKFWLSDPVAKPRPQVECKVLAPPGEMERLRMNQPEMEQAAAATLGKFYSLATAERLIDELPPGTRVTVSAAGPPFLVWNMVVLFLLALALVTTEWLLRKQKNLL